MGKERVEEMKSGGVEGSKSLPVEESEKRNAEQLPPAVESGFGHRRPSLSLLLLFPTAS